MPRPLVFLLLVSWTIAQFVTQPTDLTTVQGAAGVQVRLKEVPAGICETNPNVKSFAGYADVSPTNHIFFWMFESRTVPPAQAPLTVRLDGGPGASSMNGIFQSMGPCTVDASGNVVNNPQSWTAASNVVFVDSPSTVGFSYTLLTNGTQSPQTAEITPTQTCTSADPGCGTYASPDVTLESNSTEAAAVVFYKAMQGIMGAMPQYAANGVNINGASYGGHYVPIFADYIAQQNKLNTPGTVQIPLKSLVIENGFYDTRVQFEAYLNYTVSPGNTYDFAPYNATQQAQLERNLYDPARGCQAQQAACNADPPPANKDSVCSAADNFCVSAVEQFFDTEVGRNEEDIRQLAPDPFPPSFYVSYLNEARVQQAIGASTNFTPASIQTFTAFNATGDDSRTGALINTAMQSLLAQGVTIAMFAGDADYDSNWIGGQVVANNIGAPGFAQAGFVNMTTQDGVVRGETRQADGLSFTRVFFAGHVSPFYEPVGTLALFERASSGMDIATGTTPMALGGNLVTKGSTTAMFREGAATIQTAVTPPGSVYNTLTHLPEAATANGTRVISKQVVPVHPMAGMTVKNFKKMMAKGSL